MQVQQPEVKEVEAPVVKSEYEDKAVAVVDDYVNVRKKPTTDSKAVGKLYKNNVGTVIGEKDGWYKIKSGSVTGYVKSEFVSIGDEKKLKKAGRRVALVETETLKSPQGSFPEGRSNYSGAGRRRSDSNWMSQRMDGQGFL